MPTPVRPKRLGAKLKSTNRNRQPLAVCKVHSRMIRAFCITIRRMLPAPAGEVIVLARHYNIPIKDWAMPQQLVTAVILDVDTEGNCNDIHPV